jgi:hypothetical protein
MRIIIRVLEYNISEEDIMETNEYVELGNHIVLGIILGILVFFNSIAYEIITHAGNTGFCCLFIPWVVFFSDPYAGMIPPVGVFFTAVIVQFPVYALILFSFSKNFSKRFAILTVIAIHIGAWLMLVVTDYITHCIVTPSPRKMAEQL